MKKIALYFISFFCLLIFTCSSNRDTKALCEYLHNFKREINSFKVIAFVPAEGCSSCLVSTIEYSRTANDQFLMVISSTSNKTNDYFMRLNKIEQSKIINDSHNLATELNFVSLTAPRYYFLKNGHIVKSIDLTSITDKSSILEEVEHFMRN